MHKAIKSDGNSLDTRLFSQHTSLQPLTGNAFRMTEFYRRYTGLPAIIHLLSKQELTLLDPRAWDDTNDSFFLSQYKEKLGLKSLLALCFTHADETYHHWRIFSDGASGACITFKAAGLRDAAKRVGGVQVEEVRYLKLKELRTRTLATAELPYLKRMPFDDENEIRMIWGSNVEVRQSLPIPISLSAIDRITLSPWMPKPLADSVKDQLKSIPGCGRVSIARSTLISNDEWKKYGAAAK